MVVSYRRDAIFHKIAVSEKLSKKVMKKEATYSQNGARDARQVDQKHVENVDRFFIDFDWFGPPKGRSKNWHNSLFGVPFGVLGAIWLQRGAVGRPDPIFAGFLSIFDRFLRNMFNFF